jgi:hypothetical protein
LGRIVLVIDIGEAWTRTYVGVDEAGAVAHNSQRTGNWQRNDEVDMLIWTSALRSNLA